MGSGLRDIMCNKGKSNGKIEHEMRAVITDWLMEISVSPNWGIFLGLVRIIIDWGIGSILHFFCSLIFGNC